MGASKYRPSTTNKESRLSEHPNTSVYLTAEDRKTVAALMQQTGLKRTPLIREAIYRMRDSLSTGEDSSRRQELLEIADRLKQIA